ANRQQQIEHARTPAGGCSGPHVTLCSGREFARVVTGIAGTFDAGIKLGSSSLQIAWVANRTLTVGRFGGQEWLAAGVGLDRSNVPAAPDPQRSIEWRLDQSTISDVPRYLGAARPLELPGAGRAYAVEELMTTLLRRLCDARPFAPPRSAVVAVPAWM